MVKVNFPDIIMVLIEKKSFSDIFWAVNKTKLREELISDKVMTFNKIY